MSATTEPSPPSEERELALVGKVELRIALADSDARIESALDTYLPPLLLKLASPHVAVRNKAIGICGHINLRIKPQDIKLPVAALLAQFRAHAHVPLLRHFDLLYIRQGIRRIPAHGRISLFPDLIRSLAASESSASHASQLFHLVLLLLLEYKLPARESEQDVQLRKDLELGDHDAACLASWLGKLILLVPNKHHQTSPSLTPEEYSFLTLDKRPETWDPATPEGLRLQDVKLKAARFLASGAFTDSERFLPALFTATDSASEVNSIGEDMLKRVLPTIDLESTDVVSTLFSYFFGDDSPNGRIKARPLLRQRIFALLTKSVRSTYFTTEIVNMVEQGVSESPPEMNPSAMQIDSAPSTRGREATKLRTSLFSYINFVARNANGDSLHRLAPIVLSKLMGYIQGQGWPEPMDDQDVASRALAYEIIGLLAKAGPDELIAEPNLRIVRWLFESLAEDRSSGSIVVSIDEALSSTLTGLAQVQLSEDTRDALEDLLIHNMKESTIADNDSRSQRRSTKYTAVKYANRCLPFASVKARWVNLLAVSDNARVKQDLGEEAMRGLNPYWHCMLNGNSVSPDQIKFPVFEVMVKYLFEDVTSEDDAMDLDNNIVPRIARFRHLCPGAYVPAIQFCRLLLLNAAQSDTQAIAIDSEWERTLNTAVSTDNNVRKHIRAHIDAVSQSASTRQLQILLGAYSAVFRSGDFTDKISESQQSFVDFCALCSDSALETVAMDYRECLDGIYSNRSAVRNTSAHLFGLLATHPIVQKSQEAAVSKVIDELCEKIQGWDEVTGSAANQSHGATLALTYYVSRLHLRKGSSAASPTTNMLVSITKQQLMSANDSQVIAGAVHALGELCLFGVIQSSQLGVEVETRAIIDKMADLAKSGKEPAVLALGRLSMVFDEDASPANPNDDMLSYVEDKLYKLHELKEAEIHFAVGEALSYLCCGWASSALATAIDVPAATPDGPVREHSLESILRRILKDCTTTTKPSLRKATVIWLLCIVQFCGHLDPVKMRLADCQIAFKRGLTDRDELVQETASRGLGLVYEKGDASIRDDLVRDLISSFSDKKTGQSQLAGQVGAETQLFEPGALPTGQGESVSTYKDIMNLAAEVGDSSLVYRFMSMASSNAIWSSRAAFGRFGLSSVLSASNMDGYLQDNPKLFSSLFRYRFDPSEAVRRSMTDIWNAIVKDSNKTIEIHFDAMLADLLADILGREWRTRQACCSAIADLIQGRPLARYEDSLERIWDMCFKVLDDIKETVRTAAASLARVLTGILIRSLESDSATTTKNASKMLDKVLPFLLSTSGLESSAQEVQALALQTLLDIIKKSSASTLRPFVPDLVEKLIGLLSSLEPQAVNYVHLNADKYGLTQGKIDDMRLSSIRSSPLMEACERCLDLLDAETMQKLHPKLEHAIKAAVGLPSKVGGSRILVSLSTRHNVLFRPHADAFLKLIEKTVLDRNETVASSYAASSGYVARCASEKQILHLAAFAQSLYFDSAGDRDQQTPRRAISAAEIVNAVSKHATDKFNSMASSFLPFVFVGKHDTNEAVRSIFEDTWSDTVAGPRAVSLYLKDIIALVDAHLDSPQWAIKHSAARTVAGATSAMAGLAKSSGEKSLDITTARILWPSLERALSGKTWEGKEVVLEAFVKFATMSGTMCAEQADMSGNIEKVSGRLFDILALSSDIVQIAIREAKRQNDAYRQFSVVALGNIASARHGKDMTDVVFDIISPIFDDTLSASQDASDKKDTASASNGNAEM